MFDARRRNPVVADLPGEWRIFFVELVILCGDAATTKDSSLGGEGDTKVLKSNLLITASNWVCHSGMSCRKIEKYK